MKFPANCNAYFVEDFFLICLNCYCSLVTFREAFFCEQSSQKTRELRREIMQSMISVHREACYCERSEQ